MAGDRDTSWDAHKKCRACLGSATKGDLKEPPLDLVLLHQENMLRSPDGKYTGDPGGEPQGDFLPPSDVLSGST